MKNTQLSVEELIQSLHALLEEMAEIPSEYATRLLPLFSITMLPARAIFWIIWH